MEQKWDKPHGLSHVDFARAELTLRAIRFNLMKSRNSG
jgi:hypothetical protein